MAEGIAQQWLCEHDINSWQTVSAGISAFEGFPTSQEAIDALSKLGIEYEGTSKPLTQKMIAAANIVLCMTPSHLVEAQSLHKKSNHIELLDPGGSIMDPMGANQSVYDAIASQLQSLIAKRLKTLIQQEA